MRVLIVLALAAAVTSPVEKVVKVLQNMQDQLKTDQTKDADMSEKMSCWCTTNTAEKTAATAHAEKMIASLTASIEAGTAKSSELQTTLEKLAKQVAKNREALNSATALRQKENGEFTSEETELSASLSSVSNAVDALAAQNSFLQTKSTVHRGIRAALFAGAEHLSAAQQASLQHFLQQPAGFNSYNSRSGGIFGILSQMKETFTNDIAQARADESQAQTEFESLAEAKNREISAGRQMTVDKTQELAQTDEDLANAKHDKELTQKSLSTDQAFLLDLEAKCKTADAEFAQRSKDRATEISAVGDALKILTDDSARDLFSSTMSFVQVKRTQSKQQRAARALRAAAARTGSKQMALLAQSAQLDAFKVVQEEIDKMVGALKNEMEEEVEHQTFCTDELRKNEKSQKEHSQTLADLEAEIEALDADIDTLKTEIATLTEQSEEMQRQIKISSENREAENKAFQQTVADQRTTQALLSKALHRLEEVYADKPEEPAAAAPAFGGALLQTKQPEQAGYEQNSNSGGVLALLQGLIGDAKGLEAESVHDEQDAQAAYQSFLTDTSSALDAARRSVAKKDEEKASKEAARVSAASTNKAKGIALAGLQKYNGELHLSCDFVIKNFSVRQEARAQEMDGLKQAKAILSGADFGL